MSKYGDIGTMTLRIENDRWQVWIGTELEILQKYSETQQNEQSSMN